eukprot:191544_1
MKLKSQLGSTYKLFQNSTKTFPYITGKNYPFQLIPYENRYFWYTMNVERIKYYQQIYSAQKNDVFIVSYPKAGNHFMKKMVVEILANSDRDSDDYLFYSDGDIGNDSIPQWEVYISQVDENIFNKRITDTSSLYNRLWWTHCDVRDFPMNNFNGKIILLCRNPKDVIVSGYHFLREYAHAQGSSYDMDDYLTYFYRGMVLFGDYFEWYKLWWLYYKENVDKNSNILWVYYEDIIEHRLEYIKNISSFLNNDKDKKISDNDYQTVFNKTNVNDMRNELKTNPQSMPLHNIIRKGMNYDWRNILNEKDSFLIDEMMFFKWSENANDIKYYQQLVQHDQYFKNCCTRT